MAASEEERLIVAAIEGDYDSAQDAIKRGADVNWANWTDNDWVSWSALMKASYKGHTEVAKLLLQEGAQVDLQNNTGQSALLCARDTKMMELLLKNGAHIDLQDNNGLTALMSASFRGDMEMVKLLLQKDAQVNLQNRVGWSALMWASNSGLTEMVNLLLRKGARVNLKNKAGFTALKLASESNKDTEVTNLLLQNGAEVELDDSFWTTLLSANQSEHAKLLLQKVDIAEVLNKPTFSVSMKSKILALSQSDDEVSAV